MKPKRPHILLVTSDQHRGDALGCAGHPCVRTPHLDRLSSFGTRFTNAFADCPVCVPQRTTWITGRPAHLNGMPAYSESHRLNRSPEQFLGSILTDAGYQTCIIGKTHWHTEPSFTAGFEEWISFERLADQIINYSGRPGVNYSGIGYNELNPALSYLPPHLYSTDWAVDQALRVLACRDESRPLCLWVSFTDPHPPNIIHEPNYSMYRDEAVPDPLRPEWIGQRELPLELAKRWMPFPPMRPGEARDARGVYFGKITNLDHQLGRLFGAFESTGLWDDTLVIYTSDHGELLGDFGGTAKSCFFDSACRVPLIVRPPHNQMERAGSIVSTMVGFDDLLPTLCDYACDCTLPTDVTGQNWRPLLEEKVGYRRTIFHGQIEDSHMLHDGRYKYLYFAGDGAEMVFDMASIGGETKELSCDHELTAQLRSKLIMHLRSEEHPHLTKDGLLNRRLPRPTNRQLRAGGTLGWGATGVGRFPV